jgi:acyl-CoA synthetase (NDP forming)
MEDVAAAVRRAANAAGPKPVLGIFMSAKGAPPMLAPIPCFQFPEAAAVALARAADYGAWRTEPPGVVPELGGIDKKRLRATIERALARECGWMPAADVADTLAALGIRTPGQRQVASVDSAVAAAGAIGYPVVLKATGDRIVHKTELGAVIVSLHDEAALRAAWQDLSSRLGDMMTGGLVQEMIAGGVELLTGVVDDPTFGPVVACATGGTRAEVFADSQFRFPPLTEADAAAMVEGLRGKPLLRGFRGAPPADEAALRDVLLRLSILTRWVPEVRELDINPLIVLPNGAVAVDARIRIDHPRAPAGTGRVRH